MNALRLGKITIHRIGIEHKYDPLWVWPWHRSSVRWPIYSFSFAGEFKCLMDLWRVEHEYAYSSERFCPPFRPTWKQRLLNLIAR
jgi:hypothetical protein